MNHDNQAFVVESESQRYRSLDYSQQDNVANAPITFSSTNGGRVNGASQNGNGVFSIDEHVTSQERKVQQVRLTWNDVNVKVPAKTNLFGKQTSPPKDILRGVSGYAEPGTLLAIMGSSGAGKSTLLNILTWRNRQNLNITGEILANGVALGPDITNISAYVQQDDLFMGELTVKEHLMFTARLRMDADLSERAKSARVQEVLVQMGLKKCENTKIGTPGKTKTISGGEMKRLSFASELLNNPSIFFCDEPTSGLDSYLAKIVVECMHSVCRMGCTVLCTIHQPSSEVFEIFDRLLLLALGKVIYHGDASQAVDHYASIGFPCPVNYNPSDHYIMQVSVIPGKEEESKQQIAMFSEKYEESAFCQDVNKFVASASQGDQTGNELLSRILGMQTHVRHKKNKPRYRVGFFGQFYACLVRALKTTYRNPLLTQVKLGQTIFAAVIVGLVYLRPYGRPYVSSEATTVVGSLFLVITNMTFSNVTTVLNSFPSEIPIFRREHFSGMYSTAVYFFSKSIAEFPTYVLLPLTYSIIVYFMFGLYPSASKFFIFFGIVVLLTNTCISFGYMVSCMSPSTAVALAVGPAVMMPLLLLGGFFISSDNIPVYLIWLKYLSWFFYTNELFNVNQWDSVGYLGCPQYKNATADSMASTVNDTGVPCLYQDGEAVLQSLGFHEANIGRDVGVMFALLVGYRMIGLAALYYRVRESTR